MLMRKTTTSHTETVLSCDPAVIAANGGREVEAAAARLADVPVEAVRARVAALGDDASDEDRASLAETETIAAECKAQLDAARKARDAKLESFRQSRDMASITVPADACRVTIRPLSAEERLAVSEAGLEVALAAKGQTDAGARAAAIRVARLEAQARVARGVVKAIDGGVEVSGAELLQHLPDGLLYPAIFELSNAITKLSELDGLGKGV